MKLFPDCPGQLRGYDEMHQCRNRGAAGARTWRFSISVSMVVVWSLNWVPMMFCDMEMGESDMSLKSGPGVGTAAPQVAGSLVGLGPEDGRCDWATRQIVNPPGLQPWLLLGISSSFPRRVGAAPPSNPSRPSDPASPATQMSLSQAVPNAQTHSATVTGPLAIIDRTPVDMADDTSSTMAPPTIWATAMACLGVGEGD